ncbi:pkinase-domain-containing protein [Mucor ambiguus]|uniref:non-specific serine/threonine protein kinase n=1 Tax=Mucor ambiguus TaxID=91626 RepID=A0A0C9MD33_9FUNG|nr:pkinase-domain-containing protein [Mucor ambiguus]
MSLFVHPLEQQPQPSEQEKQTFVPDSHIDSTAMSQQTHLQQAQQQTPSSSPSPPPPRPQQRAYSVTAMPSELQKSVMRHQEAEHQEKLRHNQPWWQYYYQLYHYHLPPGRKPTVFGPYLLLQTMGEGEFGKVKFGIEVKTGQEVAIKLIRKDSIDSTSRMTKVEREISVLRILRHPNIVELFDVIETEKYIGIILQCATGGELFDYILAHRYLKERDASRLFAQLISGVHYMHQKHIVHRDLKLENLLLDKHRNVLITDFGFANQFTSPQDDLMSTSCGSPCYAAPELVMNQGVYVGPAVDIWSCGVILFAMLCGYLPYDDDPANPESYNINLLYKYILNTPLIFPDYISEEACDLLSLMLVPDPEKRCTMETIMAHPWLSPHQHLFVQIPQEEDSTIPEEEQSEEEEQVVPSQDAPMPESARRNTTIGVSQYQNDANEVVDIPQSIKEQEVSSEDQEMEELPSEQHEDTTTHVAAKDTPMQDISTIELPPLTVTTTADETDETSAAEGVAKQQAEQQPLQQENETSVASSSPSTTSQKQGTPIIQDEVPPISPLPTVHQKTQNRPKSTISSTEKVLHFLSGHSNTPKPGSTNEKRTRHMSLAIENGSPSILQAKFLSSINQRKTASPSPSPQQQQPTPEASPSPNTSVSTPHPSKKPNNTKRNVRLSTMTPPPHPQPLHTSDRGTRRKTLSLLVNSMADNTKMPFSNRRQSNTRTPPPPSTAAATEERVHMMPSVSEHTINRMTDKEKHRSAGKKLMDWFKKKPLSTIHRSTNQSSDTMLHNSNDRPSSSSNTNSEFSDATAVIDPKLRTHHGAVDQEALTSRPPAQVFAEVKAALKALGLECKRDGGEYKLKCSRPKRPAEKRNMNNHHYHQNGSSGGNPPFRMLLRRSSAHQSTVSTSTTTTTTNTTIKSSDGGNHDINNTKPATIYGDPNVDPGEEVRFSVELCKIKNLPGLYIVDMRRMRGNVWAYKFIYRTLLDTLKLGGKSGYLNTEKQQQQEAPPVIHEESTANNRFSIASSSGGNSSSIFDDAPHTPSPPNSTSKEANATAATAVVA